MRVEVDGSGLARPRAGVGVYTRQLLTEMGTDAGRASIRLHVPGPPGPPLPGVAVENRPRTPLLGRHLVWPARLRAGGADVYLGPAGQMPLGDIGMPGVITVHDLAIYRDRSWFPGGQALSTRLVVPRSIRRAAALIAVSRSTAADLEDLFGVEPERVTVIPHGVSAAFRPGPPDPVLRRRLGLPERFMLFVGTIEPRKNLRTLLEVLADWPQAPPLVIAGSWGWGFERERQGIRAAGPRVLMLGELEPDELPALYRLAAVLAHPAWYEGFGLTVLEAMACGLPVVVADVSSLPEVVGDAGLKVDPADVPGWRSALGRVVEDPVAAAELSRRGLERAATFTWRRTAELTWDVLRRAAGSS